MMDYFVMKNTPWCNRKEKTGSREVKGQEMKYRLLVAYL